MLSMFLLLLATPFLAAVGWRTNLAQLEVANNVLTVGWGNASNETSIFGQRHVSHHRLLNATRTNATSSLEARASVTGNANIKEEKMVAEAQNALHAMLPDNGARFGFAHGIGVGLLIGVVLCGCCFLRWLSGAFLFNRPSGRSPLTLKLPTDIKTKQTSKPPRPEPSTGGTPSLDDILSAQARASLSHTDSYRSPPKMAPTSSLGTGRSSPVSSMGDGRSSPEAIEWKSAVNMGKTNSGATRADVSNSWKNALKMGKTNSGTTFSDKVQDHKQLIREKAQKYFEKKQAALDSDASTGEG